MFELSWSEHPHRREIVRQERNFVTFALCLDNIFGGRHCAIECSSCTLTFRQWVFHTPASSPPQPYVFFNYIAGVCVVMQEDISVPISLQRWASSLVAHLNCAFVT